MNKSTRDRNGQRDGTESSCYASVTDDQGKGAKSPSKVGYRLVEIIKSLASSGATKWTRGEGGLGLGASDSRQGRYDMCIVQIKSRE